ncbi:hypothetical protein Dsin_007951 [Dipteronia sinensis]|uniref:HAT C-terminal dimerisation domain-containing protein n=1 Tax=Dipteronia sinensis TaxID=43782 RepID=A0AAE0B2G9_9ROSI|nr:hypothetical protein Dsin_007951 [Dipteronia sinensis]
MGGYGVKEGKANIVLVGDMSVDVLSDMVRKKIREEVGDAKFSILVDKALDEFNREQMAIILCFVDREGFIRERFFQMVGVNETSAPTLKNAISKDFSGSEIDTLRRQLEHYELDVPNDSEFQNISSLSELCHRLFETFHLIDRLIRLVLTLPVSTATIERAYSAMKFIKTTLRNKMEDEFLASCMMIYIER